MKKILSFICFLFMLVTLCGCAIPGNYDTPLKFLSHITKTSAKNYRMIISTDDTNGSALPRDILNFKKKMKETKKFDKTDNYLERTERYVKIYLTDSSIESSMDLYDNGEIYIEFYQWPQRSEKCYLMDSSSAEELINLADEYISSANEIRDRAYDKAIKDATIDNFLDYISGLKHKDLDCFHRENEISDTTHFTINDELINLIKSHQYKFVEEIRNDRNHFYDKVRIEAVDKRNNKNKWSFSIFKYSSYECYIDYEVKDEENRTFLLSLKYDTDNAYEIIQEANKIGGKVTKS